MNRKILFVLTALILIIALMAVPAVSLADAGGFVGDSDWGSLDFGDFDFGSSDWDSDYDYGSDYDYESGLGTGVALGSCLGGGGIGSAVIIIVIIIIILSIKSKKKGASSANRVNYAPRSADITALRNADPAFSEQMFLEKARNLYVRLQNAWTQKNLEQVRTEFSGPMYSQLERQLAPFIQNGQTNYVDRITVLAADIVDYKQDEVNDILTVRLQTRIVDYVKDDNTQNVIRGSETKELFMTYEWSFIRTKGKTTPLEEGAKRTTCPSCGAPIDLNHTAKCEYCGAVISDSEYDWVVNEIRGISQRS
ncbi:MAG: TIM44-like domain-containing protein [Christensenellaceae bacterium]|nr:TIM44-like domain-containing protein [Christensenellaceae bacterium]